MLSIFPPRLGVPAIYLEILDEIRRRITNIILTDLVPRLQSLIIGYTRRKLLMTQGNRYNLFLTATSDEQLVCYISHYKWLYKKEITYD